ncbi:MAG: hypothetical protein WBV37_04580 [Nocardioidaceae bacterium]
MPSSRRRTRLPAATREQLVLDDGERPLAWATDREGRWYVGTDRALHLATDQGFRRLGWEQVERADWQQDAGRLAVVEVSAWGEPEPRTAIEVDDAGQLLELLRERITKSVVATRYARVRGKAGLSVVGRRSPAGQGPIVWSYLLSAGLDPDDPEVTAVAERTLTEAQRELSGL